MFHHFWNGNASERLNNIVEEFILKARYLLVLLYCALVYGIITIIVDFFKEVASVADESSLAAHTIQELHLVDMTMIANLIWFIIAGSYYVFVSEHSPIESGKKVPRCLAHLSSGLLKEKIAGSLVAVALVALLKVFLNLTVSSEKPDWLKISLMLGFFLTFVIGLFAFNYSNKADHHSHNQEQSKERKEMKDENKHS